MTQAAVVQKIEYAASQSRDGGLKPTSPLHNILVNPVPYRIARELFERHHYLHSLPGGTKMAFGVFLEDKLLGAITFGAGPQNAYHLISDACPRDCLTLTRLWLSDELPANSESRVLAVLLKAIKHHTRVKFLITYADPSQGHLGIIYQATNWLYTGLSSAMPLYDLGDGKARHSRSMAAAFGSHSVKYFIAHGVPMKMIPQIPKHRYVYFLEPSWRNRLGVAVLPYPKQEVSNERR